MCAAVRPLVITLALVIGFTVSAGAADTGTVSGSAFDQNGQPVADATARISGDLLPVGRSAQTGANGLYQFQYLLPGEYVLEIEKSGVGRSTRRVVVEVGKDTQVAVALGYEHFSAGNVLARAQLRSGGHAFASTTFRF